MLNKVIMTNIIDFDWEFYLKYNIDVSNCYCYCDNGAILHYDTHGMNENRIYSEEMLFKTYPLMKHFDSEFYKLHNKDLRELTHYQLIQHYLSQGHRDKRAANFTSHLYEYTNKKTKINHVNEDKKISIIMIVQDDSETLQYAIDSILNQTYKNIEIIIVDDMSNKRTKSMLTQYIRNSQVILLENETKHGYFPSVNMALSMCSGDYITLHGASDISFPQRLATLMFHIDSNSMTINNISFISRLPIHDIALSKNFHELFMKLVVINRYNEPEFDNSKHLNNSTLYHASLFDNVIDLDNEQLQKMQDPRTHKVVNEMLYIMYDM